jgi:ribosomal protein S12 methylthiotransferase accessory factor
MIGLSAEHLNAQVGLVPSLNEARPDTLFVDGCRMFSAQSGYLKALHPELDLAGEPSLTVVGAGCSADGEEARGKALVETLERYAMAYYAGDEVVTATAEALGAEAMDWSRLARLDPGSGGSLPGFDPAAPMRWVRGYHLVERRPVFVPLVMVHIHVAPLEGERFHIQSTGGAAAHASLDEAVLAAFYEAVERDAVEAVWAMRLPLPRIEMDGPMPAELERLVATDEADFVDQRYFDATTDLYIPTVYAVRALRPPVGHDLIVTCASHPDPAVAALKARREASGLQLMRMHESGGACYSRFAGEPGFPVGDRMAVRPDLSFLHETPARRLAELGGTGRASPSDSSEPLRRIAREHPDIVALNLTTDALRGLGIHVAKILIPTLLRPAPDPRTGLPRARIEQLARHFRVAVPGPAELNPCPQPFR